MTSFLDTYATKTVRIAAIMGFAGLLIVGIIYFKQDAEWRQLGWPTRLHQVYYLPSPPVLERLSLGHRSFLADLVWIRGLLYVGSHFSQNGSIDWLPRYARAVVTLDPKFRYAYVWGAVLVLYNRRMSTRKDAMTSIEFLNMGQKQFPHDYFFPYSLGMNYLSEIRLSRRTMPQLVQDFKDYCPATQMPLLTLSATALTWQTCFEEPFSWLTHTHCKASHFMESAAQFVTETHAKRQIRVPFIHQIKRCLRKTAALYLMEAASKEGAPAHYAPLAARIMKRDGNANAAICDHLLHVIWRAESDEVRERVRQRIQRYCGGKRPVEIMCQEEQFAKKWREQFGYVSRATFQMIDIPTQLEQRQPLEFPLLQNTYKCSLSP